MTNVTDRRSSTADQRLSPRDRFATLDRWWDDNRDNLAAHALDHGTSLMVLKAVLRRHVTTAGSVSKQVRSTHGAVVATMTCETAEQTAEQIETSAATVRKALQALAAVGVLTTVERGWSAGCGGGAGRAAVRQVSFLLDLWTTQVGDRMIALSGSNDRALQRASNPFDFLTETPPPVSTQLKESPTEPVVVVGTVTTERTPQLDLVAQRLAELDVEQSLRHGEQIRNAQAVQTHRYQRTWRPLVERKAQEPFWRDRLHPAVLDDPRALSAVVQILTSEHRKEQPSPVHYDTLDRLVAERLPAVRLAG